DGDSNSANTTCTFDVTVIDDEAPVITNCPAPVNPYSVDAGECDATLSFTATATDNCNTDVALSYSIPSGPISFPYNFPTGTTTVTVTADDGDSNSSNTTCTFDVVVIDNEAPVVTCPTPATSYNTDPGECDATLSFTATATDNCDSEVALSYSIPSGPISFPYNFPTGTTTVTVTADDGDSNSSNNTCTFDVVVIDNEAPVVTCPTPAAFYNTDPSECDATLSFTATATDNCDSEVALSYSIPSGPISFPYNFPTGTTTVTVTADDGDSNSANTTCTFDVTVIDNELPAITC
ncbi:HYR domain-containing protein, partial [Christiangramia aquimixticola]|uniref:HYR domain-containing protein n=1 Tax=Christiangramia aquimixticola TaxID=1697558 RepID=UPI003AA922ED